jgi:hypothetical protein
MSHLAAELESTGYERWVALPDEPFADSVV